MRSFKRKAIVVILTVLTTLSLALPALANGLIGGG